jgi:hypothetical protein
MPKVLNYYNSKCLKCGKLHEKMLRVGCMVFCRKCAFEVFDFSFALGDESFLKAEVPHNKIYSKWLKKYSKMQD